MAYRDSGPAVTVLQLQGVWIADPDAGGQESARNYPYGASQRDEGLDTLGEASFFAGRADPVVDFGEHEVHSFAVTVDIPHGPAWRTDLEDLRAWARARKTLHVRDNRGRAVYGTLEGLRMKDAPWGTQVSFTVTKTGRVQEVVSV